MGAKTDRSLVCTLILVFAGLLCGCQLPDVAPFVDATGQLKAAVASSGAAVEEDLRNMPGGDPQADKLKAAWKVRDQAMAALLRYAQSLDAIVASGKSGSQSAAMVADSVKTLAETIGVGLPGAPAVMAAGTDVAKFIYAQIATVRAANELARALETAQPAVERIADLIRLDMLDLDAIVQAADQLTFTSNVSDFNRFSAYRKELSKALESPRDLTNKALRDELAELSRLMADSDQRYAAYQARLNAITDRLRASRQLINATGSALDAWTAAHAQLATAARQKKPVKVSALVDAAAELRELIKKVRAT